MNILVTGADGFIGKNLIAELHNQNFLDINEFTTDNSETDLKEMLSQADFVFHLAGVNRPKSTDEFYLGNTDLTQQIVNILCETKHYIPVLISSSIQAELDNDYGKSKKLAEQSLFDYHTQTSAQVFVYRLSNVFGKWSRPNYNSAVATFCYNLSRGLPITINDPSATVKLVYIDDVIKSFISALNGQLIQRSGDYCEVIPTTEIQLGELTDKIKAFAENRKTLVMPSLRDQFDRDLYGTYLSFLAEDNFSYYLDKKSDDRGWLAEFIKSKDNGQIFISTTKPGVTRGNHWHHTKVEKFLVVQGTGQLEFRSVNSDKVLKYVVKGDQPEVVDIPTGYIHNIKNIGNDTMITIFWACEIFDPNKPDTYYEGV